MNADTSRVRSSAVAELGSTAPNRPLIRAPQRRRQTATPYRGETPNQRYNYPVMDAETFNRRIREYADLAGTRAGERIINEIVRGNMRLVLRIACRFMRQGVSFDDLVQEGAIGLTIGLRRFDLREGTALSTFATPWIYQSIQRFLLNDAMHCGYRLPARLTEGMKKIRNAERIFYAQNGKLPDAYETYCEIQHQEVKRQQKFDRQAKRRGVEPKRVAPIGFKTVVQLYRMTNVSALSLDDAICSDTVASLYDIVPNRQSANPETFLDCARLASASSRIIRRGISALSPREREIFRQRFEEPGQISLHDIGERFGLTRERIRRLETKALTTMSRATNMSVDQLLQILEAREELHVQFAAHTGANLEHIEGGTP